MRRYAVASLLFHAVFLTALSRPPAEPKRAVYADPVYAVALVPGEPNYEPPVPAAPPRPQPKPEPEKKAPPPQKKPDAVTVPTEKKKPEPARKKDSETGKTAVTSTKPAESGVSGQAPGSKGTVDAPVSMGSVDQKDFTHDYYLELLRSMLARAWNPPPGGTGVLRASVHLVIQRDGTIVKPEVVAGSGWGLYDRSTVSAVLDVRKFPPLPEAYAGGELGLTVNFQRQGEGP
jgi:outer membrane biosynthesis protein TonB